MCVYIKHRAQKPSFPEAKALHRAVWHSRPRRASHHYVHTGPDSHTRTQPVWPDSPEAPLLLFPQPRSRRALDYLGLFRHRHMKLRQPSSQKKKKKKSQSVFSRWPTLSMFWIEQALPTMSPLGAFLLPPSGGGEVFWRYGLQGGWVRLPDGCGWCCGAWSLAPSRDSPGRLVWEPGTLRRQTRAELCARRAERQAEAHETQARKSSLSWRARFHLHLPGHGSVDWQWGWVGLPEASRDGIYRLTLPEVTEERNPSMTKHELPTSNKSLMRGGPQPESGACYEGVLLTHPAASLPHPPPTPSITSALKEPSCCSPWVARFLPLPLSSPTDALHKVGMWTALSEYNRTWEWWTILFRITDSLSESLRTSGKGRKEEIKVYIKMNTFLKTLHPTSHPYTHAAGKK